MDSLLLVLLIGAIKTLVLKLICVSPTAGLDSQQVKRAWLICALPSVSNIVFPIVLAFPLLLFMAGMGGGGGKNHFLWLPLLFEPFIDIITVPIAYRLLSKEKLARSLGRAWFGYFAIVLTEYFVTVPCLFIMDIKHDSNEAPTAAAGLYGAVDRDGHLVITSKYLGLNDFHEGLAGAQPIIEGWSNPKWSFVDKQGTQKIAAKFDQVHDFREDLALVQNPSDEEPHLPKFGFIDKHGSLVVPMRFDEAKDFENGLACVKENGEEFWLDKQGHTRPRQELPLTLAYLADVSQYGSVEGVSFSEGVLPAFETGAVVPRYGFVDKQKWLLRPTYEEARNFKNGFAAVKSDGRWGFIDHNFKMAVVCKFDDVGNFGGGLAPIKQNSKWGYVDQRGHVVVPPTYSNATIFSDGRAAVQNSQGLWGYIDVQGKLVIPQVYQTAHPFSEGLAVVQVLPSHITNSVEPSGNTPMPVRSR